MSAADLFDLTGKVGLVTGANSGLGFGFASGIAKCGGDVVVWGRRAEKNLEAAQQLRKVGARRVHCQSIDVSQEDQVVAGMVEAVEVMGRVDGVVANAGITGSAPLHEMSTKAYEDVLAVNQHGGFFTLREGVKHMKARADAGDPGGSVIVCGSLTTFLGHKGMAHYGAAKGAMASMMRSIAVEYGRDGIRANMVCAGLFHSEIMAGAPDELLEAMRQVMREKNPIPRLGYPEDLEGITAYLMSDCSKYHTGDLIVIDGGQSIVTIV
jgi:NAD(P)-dependent dehydrogenase (short-subunit alcohol dehydrogenase family)